VYLSSENFALSQAVLQPTFTKWQTIGARAAIVVLSDGRVLIRPLSLQ
jgi:hypothetical protein